MKPETERSGCFNFHRGGVLLVEVGRHRVVVVLADVQVVVVEAGDGTFPRSVEVQLLRHSGKKSKNMFVFQLIIMLNVLGQ